MSTDCLYYLHLSKERCERVFSQFTQIPHDSGSASIPYTVGKLLPRQGSNQCRTPLYEFKAPRSKPLDNDAEAHTNTHIYTYIHT